MRLIDADVLIKRFDEIAEGKIERIVGVNCESLTDKMSQIVRIARENGEKQTFKNFIDEQPVAYDIDKVMEQLEEERITAVDAANIFCKPEYDAFVYGMEKAIEIVKSGGAE